MLQPVSYKLEKYQEEARTKVSEKLAKVRSLVAVAPTAFGKTILLVNIANRFIERSEKNVIIFVHKIELLNQTREKLLSWYGIIAQKIDADTNEIRPNRIYVAMVETFDRRSDLDRFLDNFKGIGLVIVDECHLNSFRKVLDHFKESKLLGVTATPVSADKKNPLRGIYDDIVILASAKDMILQNEINPARGIVPAIEYSLQGGIQKDFKTKGEDFDDKDMGNKLSRPKQIQNTLDGYFQYGYNKKGIVFNANIEHSILMHNSFKEAGIESRHLDSKKSGKFGGDSYRRDTFEWMHATPNAILNNVGIATIGTDIPSVELIIVNKSTKVLSLYKQMIGRGGRAYQRPDGSFKEHFTNLDMGDNIQAGGHGLYEETPDWEALFWNPKIPRAGVTAIKICPECKAMTYASARICTGKVEDWLNDNELVECGFIFDMREFEEDLEAKNLIRIGYEGIDVPSAIKFFESRGEHGVFRKLQIQIANMYAEKLTTRYLDAFSLEGILTVAHGKCTQWFKLMDKRKFQGFTESVYNDMIGHLKDAGFDIPVEEIEEVMNKVKDKNKLT